MSFKKPSFRLRTAFTWLAAGTIIFNFAFDLMSFRKIDSLNESGRHVDESYQALLKLQRLDRAVELLLIPPAADNELTQVTAEIDTVKGLAGSARQRFLLRDLDDMVRSRSGAPGEATKMVAEMMAIESDRLRVRMSAEAKDNQQMEKSMMRALLLDTVLVAVLCLFFIGEIRARRRVERNLKNSLGSLRETNLALQEEQARRHISLKTTVHDLKNPLSTIYGFAELISGEAESAPTVQEFSEIIRRVSQNSLALVESLLSAQQKTQADLSPVNLAAVIDEVCVQIGVQAQAKGQSIIKNLPPGEAVVGGDRVKLEELTANLLSNAVKYSPLGSTIRVSLKPLAGKFRVVVEDQGQGFSRDDKRRLFQFGQRLSAKPTGAESSTGYGLFIARQIIEMHGGKIEIADAKSGVGAVVSFELPAMTADKLREDPTPRVDA
jgi:signal transduction histidine kinase